MKALKIAGAAIAAVIVVIALLLVIGVPSGYLTAQIQERVERETGYKLAINGGAKIGLWPQLNIRLNDVTLENPRDRDINRRFTAASIEADVTLASLWAGKPQITDLVIIRPVVNLPLQRERARDTTPATKPASGKSADAFSIEHVSITGGTIVLSNVRDRVERRIETVNADITVDADRKVVLTGSGRSSGSPLKFEVKAALPAAPVERQNIPAEIKIDAPGLLTAQLTAKAEARLNGSVVMINSVTGALGDGAFNGWASVDLSSKPLVKLDLDFQRLTVEMSRSTDSSAQPWSNATIDVNGLNYVDLQARISAAELKIGDARFTPAAIDANLTSGVLKAQVSNLGAYEGNASGDLTADVSTATPTYAMRADLTGVRALPLLSGLADFDKLDGKMQAKISVRSSGISQRAIMSNMAGTAFVVFQDGAIKGLNVAQMIRSLTASTLSGWQESAEKATDLSQLSASFRIDKGQAQTTDLNLVGPLVKMTGVGTIDLGTKQIGFRVEPKLVMTTEGQGRAGDPVGFGIPVMIEGPWGSPRIYPEMQGILDNPEAGYAKLKEMGKGLFGPNGAGLGAAIGNLLGGQPGTAGGQGNASGTGQAGKPNEPLGGQLGETIGNLIQQGLSGLGQGQGGARPGGQRSLTPTSPAEAPTQAAPPQAAPAEPAAPTPPGDTTAQQDSQPMNEVLRQLFNR
ncbi:AsmA family protein [Bradyrhizobium sp. CCBAU 051011]|uniref:AsmA family protein n=1 Tax=Bradyrhizobium sp. CCBAU 051011 TaxID=858422 RepID=UPI00137431A0|nr:AsmA family protein [Bradyrhizobium sp. CCBAU 051011]QHO72788.1 AsmA family protein [Bradyrhizobium sp. CCBAU 051011]